MRRFLDGDDHDDPMLSVVNVIDVFLVIVVMLLIMVARSNVNAQQSSHSESAGTAMPDNITTLERFETNGEMGEGAGVKAGTTYRLDDGTLVFVPESGAAP